ncbi:MAG: response regulator [Bacteroidia bacterium]|nr:response regulator [Bacteroidia bacterium]
MKLAWKLSVLLALTLVQIPLFSQNFSFMELSPSDGFPSKINTIFVEQDGFAWIGSDDGVYQIYANNYFSHHVPDGEFLSSSNVTRIYFDETGTAWMLTDVGFYGFLSSIHHDHPQMILGIDGKTVAHSVVSKGKDVYFGGDNIVWKYSHETGAFTELLKLDPSKPFTVNQLLIGYGNGGNDLIMVSDFTREMAIYNIATKECRPSQFKGGNDFFAAFTGSDGTLWISMLGQGIFNIAADGTMLKSFSTKNSGINSDVIICFAEREGKLWLGTDGGGINILDPETGEVTILKNDPADPSTCPSNMISTMFCDHNGNVWCGRPSGGAFVVSESKIKQFKNGVFDPPVDNRGICSFYQLPGDQMVWIGTNGSGLVSYDLNTGEFFSYPVTDNMHIHSIASMSNGDLVLSCPNQGIFVFNPKTNEMRRNSYDLEAKLFYFSTDRSPVFCNDQSDNVIIFTDRLSRYYPSGAFDQFPQVEGVKGYLRPVCGSHAQYMIDDASLYRWEETSPTKTRRILDMSSKGRVRCATFAEDGSIWISAGSSIYSYDTVTGEVEYVFDSFETEPHMMMTADDGRLWMGTRNKLYVYNPATKGVLLLGETDGVFNNEYLSGACLQASNGELFLGGRNGFICVGRDFEVNTVRNVGITVGAVLVDNDEIFDLSGFAVPYHHSQIDIRMLVRSNDILKDKLYHVVASGPSLDFDEYLTEPVVHFLRLNPGKYSVSMSVTTSDGGMTDMREVYSFSVKRPWYRSAWFYLAASLLLLCALLLLMRYRGRIKDKRHAQEASDERYNFLINVAHELRTPLTLVQGPVKRMLRDKSISAEQRSSLNRVFQQSSRISDLLNTVLTSSRIEDGATKVNLQSVDVNSWVTNLAEDFRDEAAEHDMGISLKLDPTIGAAMMDEGLCAIVFSNIMSNALKHNPPGKDIVVWTSWNREKGMIRVGIRDNGPGIGRTDPSKLFEKYYKETEEHAGFGIGLSYAKVIIDAHGGSITANNNEDDKGATFWFEIPADHEAIKTTEQIIKQIDERAEKISEKAMIDKCILYVDDNIDLREYIMEELGPLCRKLITANNGKTAIKAIQSHDVDVVITDIMMPEIDGITLCKTIKFSDHFKHIPVILLTAKADLETMNLGREVRADAFIPKPFEIEELIDAVKGKRKK